MKHRQLKISIGTALLALIVLSCSVSAGVSAGSEAPVFTLTSVSEREYRLSDFRGRPVIINFFTTWCGPCREEMPALQKMFAQYRRQGLVLLAVDLGDDPEEVSRFRKELELRFPLLLDPRSKVGNQYGVMSYPRTFFIDTDGVVRKTIVGAMTQEVIEAEIKNLLELAETARENGHTLISGSGVEGCISTEYSMARTGPDKKYAAELKLRYNECYAFDRRTANNDWLRLSNSISTEGEALWAPARDIELAGGIDSLTVWP